MKDNRKVSLCITTWNRDDLVVKSFEKVLSDNRISEIVIVDDYSDFGFYKSLELKINRIKGESEHGSKIKLYRNISNLDCYHNKAVAINSSTNEWCILFDSDNVMDVDYLDALYNYPWDKNTLFQPEFARPHFDWRNFSGVTLNKLNVTSYIDRKGFDSMINAMNFFVNKHEYLKAYDPSINPHTADSILINKNWLALGNNIHITPGLQYDHLIHEGSHYKNNVHKTENLFEVFKSQIYSL